MLWSRAGRSAPGELIAEPDPLDNSGPAVRARSVERIYAHAEGNGLDGAGKNALLRSLAKAVGFPYDELVATRRLCMMSADEVRAVAAAGIDVHLHTHRHDIPHGPDGLERELADNRAALAEMGVTSTAHFCYPNGRSRREMWDTLRRNGVRSATTCDAGPVSAESERYALPRFLDSESVSQVEFEAWASGFLPLVDRLFGRRHVDLRQ